MDIRAMLAGVTLACVFAGGFARAALADEDQRHAVYFTAFITWVWCPVLVLAVHLMAVKTDQGGPLLISANHPEHSEHVDRVDIDADKDARALLE
jgi:hypothetical protein